MNKKHITISAVVIITFFIAQKSYIAKLLLHLTNAPMSPTVRLILYYLSWFIPIVIAVLALNKSDFGSFFTELGLTSNIASGFIFAFLATLPMLIGYALLSDMSKNISILFVLQKAILPGFMEELLFRGFLFGILFRRAGWGFIPAVVLNALFFAGGHLYQSSDLLISLGIFIITLMGGSWFAWLYVEWDECLWLPIGLHIFMNLWWIVFAMGDTALGGSIANVFRIATIVITIVVTIRKRKKAGYFVITGKNLIFNKVKSD